MKLKLPENKMENDNKKITEIDKQKKEIKVNTMKKILQIKLKMKLN